MHSKTSYHWSRCKDTPVLLRSSATIATYVQKHLDLLRGITLGLLAGHQDVVNVGKNTTRGDGDATKELVELLIVADCKLNVTRNDTRLLVVTGSIAGQFENFGCQVLHHSGHVDRGTCTNSISVATLAEETVNATNRELEAGLGGTGLSSLFRGHCCKTDSDSGDLLVVLEIDGG